MDKTNSVVIEEEIVYASLLKAVTKSGKHYDIIVTTGRGGLSIAQKLAYALDVKVDILQQYDLCNLSSNMLFVDDIVCTGGTIGSIPRGVDVATLVHRKSALHKPTFTGLVYEGPEYIKFSWES
jgi:hypoxanthine phosphoribosyltransferase